MKSFDVAQLDAAVVEASQLLWNFNSIEREVEGADVILLMGSNDLSVAAVAAQAARRHPQAIIICSGGKAHDDDLLTTGWDDPEADMFADAVIGLGIPSGRVVRERRARNTAENVKFSRELCLREGRRASAVCVVQKPFMCLRAYLTTVRHWPEARIGVTHECIGFLDYLRRYGDASLIDILVGDTQRVMRYPAAGYFDAVTVPDEVSSSFAMLVERGYVGHLIDGPRAR